MRWSGRVSIFYFSSFPKKDTKIDTFGLDRPDHFPLKTKAFYSQLFAFQNPCFVSIKIFSNYAERFFDFTECYLLKGKNNGYARVTGIRPRSNQVEITAVIEDTRVHKN